MALTKIQDANYQYFIKHLNEWLENLAYKDKYVVIHEKKIQRVQDEFSTAFQYAVSHFPRDEFIIQKIISEESVR